MIAGVGITGFGQVKVCSHGSGFKVRGVSVCVCVCLLNPVIYTNSAYNVTCLSLAHWRNEHRDCLALKGNLWSHWILLCSPKTLKPRDQRSRRFLWFSLNPPKFIRSIKGTQHSQNFSVHRDTERNKEIGFLEAQIYEYVEILGVCAL